MQIEDLKILIVDDNANMRRLINTILRSLNIRNTMEAASGAEALTILKSWSPDLALVDYVMDGIDGVQFTRMVRSDVDKPGRKRLPIILVTGYAELWRLQEAKEAGANDFVAKPFTTKTLMQKILRVVSSGGMTMKEMEEAARQKQA